MDDNRNELPPERRHDYAMFVDAIQANTIRMAELVHRVEAIQAGHKCRFEEDEARAMHRFAQSMANGGWPKFQAVLDFGDTLIQVKRAGMIAFVGAVVLAFVGLLVAGFKVKFGGGA
jgi:hypothetical protein